METKPIYQFPKTTLEYLLSGISFFKAVRLHDQAQFDFLLQSSRIVSYQPDEIVVQKGEQGNWLYFLLKGKLAVYVDEPLQSDLVNYVTPGEVFGDLAQLIGLPRTATIIADRSAKESLVLALDFNVFGALGATAPISLATKLIYYRNMAHNLRWKLEVYRSQHLQHSLANKHRQIKLYHGVKDSYEELQSLVEQSKALAKLLIEWNREFDLFSGDTLQRPA